MFYSQFSLYCLHTHTRKHMRHCLTYLIRQQNLSIILHLRLLNHDAEQLAYANLTSALRHVGVCVCGCVGVCVCVLVSQSHNLPELCTVFRHH